MFGKDTWAKKYDDILERALNGELTPAAAVNALVGIGMERDAALHAIKGEIIWVDVIE